MSDLVTITSESILEALRLWHGGERTFWPLAKMRLTLQIPQQDEAYGSLAEAGPAAQNRAVLSLGLDELKKSAPEAEDLLRARFEHRRDVLSIANSLNISEPSVYYRQRQAVNQLTEILNQLEGTASTDWRNRMIARLELQTYHQLIGVNELRSTLTRTLIEDGTHFIIAIDGLGGLGKTALADRIVRDLIQTTHFDEIAWATAKHTHLSTLGRLQIESGRPALTFPMLVDKLANQFDLPIQNDSTHLEQQRMVKQFLQNRACLIVIDNLETAVDYHSLLPELRKWQNPTKFLLTSRVRLLDEPNVFSLSLKELSVESSFELIRSEAARTGFKDLAKASDTDLQAIYRAVGGNPLALKLIVGQLRFHSLSYVLERFAPASKQSTEAGIFDYIYREIWESLDNEHKMTLLALTQAGETGFDLEHLANISSSSLESTSQNLEKLILLSMVDLSGNLFERRYRLHRLTEVFLLNTFGQS